MSDASIIMAMFLEPFKAAAADGAVVELKLRLLAGKSRRCKNMPMKPEL